jgi:hypothetical protein
MSAVSTMPHVAKKKNNQVPVPPPVEEDEGVQVALRLFSKRLLRAVDDTASEERRSRNLMLNLLIEEALKARGKWPPKPTA